MADHIVKSYDEVLDVLRALVTRMGNDIVAMNERLSPVLSPAMLMRHALLFWLIKISIRWNLTFGNRQVPSLLCARQWQMICGLLLHPFRLQ